MMRRAAVVMMTCLGASPGFSEDAQGTFVSGSKLYNACRTNRAEASNMVAAVADALVVMPGSRQLCFPADVTVDDLTSIVCGSVELHPKRQKLGAALLVFKALQSEFPCIKELIPLSLSPSSSFSQDKPYTSLF